MKKRSVIYLLLTIIVLFGVLLINDNKDLLHEEVIYVTAKNELDTSCFFSREEVEQISKLFPNLWFSYAYETSETLYSANRNCNIKLIITNENYTRWHAFGMREGRFLNKESDIKNQMVIDRQTAFQLQGSSTTISNEIKMDNQKWIVYGITEKSKVDRVGSIGEQLIGTAYILGDKEKYKDIMFKNLIIGGGNGQQLEMQQIVNKVLVTLGKNKEDYETHLLTEYSHQAEEYLQVLVSSIVIMALAIFWTYFGKRIVLCFRKESTKMKKYYLKEYIYINKGRLLKYSLMMIGAVVITDVVIAHIIKIILPVLVTKRIVFTQTYGAPDIIKYLQYIDQLALRGLILGEVMIVINLVSIWRGACHSGIKTK